MGVVCIYNILGFKANTKKAINEANLFFVSKRTDLYKKIHETIKAIPETIEPATPDLHKISKFTKGSISICCRGSQIPPNCAKPGVSPEITLFEMFRCDSASPYIITQL